MSELQPTNTVLAYFDSVKAAAEEAHAGEDLEVTLRSPSPICDRWWVTVRVHRVPDEVFQRNVRRFRELAAPALDMLPTEERELVGIAHYCDRPQKVPL